MVSQLQTPFHTCGRNILSHPRPLCQCIREWKTTTTLTRPRHGPPLTLSVTWSGLLLTMDGGWCGADEPEDRAAWLPHRSRRRQPRSTQLRTQPTKAQRRGRFESSNHNQHQNTVSKVCESQRSQTIMLIFPNNIHKTLQHQECQTRYKTTSLEGYHTQTRLFMARFHPVFVNYP